MAGIVPGTFQAWITVGRAIKDGRLDHPLVPDDKGKQQEFIEFLEAVEKARVAQRLQAVTNIIKAGRERWVHRITGSIQMTAPPPVTWLNETTGELYFQDPHTLRPANEWPEGTHFIKQYSGEAWHYDSGSWQALAWFLERSDPDAFARRSYGRIEGLDKLLELTSALGLSTSELLMDLVEELQSAFNEDDSPESSAPDSKS